MTLRAVGFGPRFPRAWLFPIIAMTLLLAVAAGGSLSRSIVADLIAWWPIWLALGIVAYLGRGAKLGPVNVSGLVPLVALATVLVFAWAHLAGWGLMPSAAQHLEGPQPGGITTAAMTIVVDGEVRLSDGSDVLYEVHPIRRGGSVSMPIATEVTGDGSATITFDVSADPGVYVYAGWDILLSDQVTWDLDVDGALNADLNALTIGRLSLAGAGSLVLGAASDAIPVAVIGQYEVTVPVNTPVRVVGAASVPATWTLTDGGAVSPGLGTGWVLTVVGTGSLTVRER